MGTLYVNLVKHFDKEVEDFVNAPISNNNNTIANNNNNVNDSKNNTLVNDN